MRVVDERSNVNLRDLLGREVIGDLGSRIGEVKDVIVDSGGWQVKAIEVELNPKVAEEFGMKKLFKGARIPIDIQHVRGIQDTVALKISKAQLGAIVQAGVEAEKAQEAKAPTTPTIEA